MRVLTLFTLTLCPALALAKSPSKTEETPAARAARLAAIDETGDLRDATLRSPTITSDVKTGNAVERAPIAQPSEEPTGPLSGALEEMVLRQMERHAAVLDHCVVEAKRRDPSLHGDMPLAVSVAKKSTTIVPSSPSDVIFKACLTASAKTIKLSVPDGTFSWHLDFGKPSALSRK